MMHRSILVVLVLVFAISAFAVDAGYQTEVEKWRKDRVQRLTSDDGWLTLVGLFWLKQGENRFGSDPNNPVVFPKDKSPAVAGTLTLKGKTVTIRTAPQVQITSEGKPVTEAVLKSDLDGKEDPTPLEMGSLNFFVIQRGDKTGIRVKDKESPNRKNFLGLDYFPIDPKWRFEAKFEPYPAGKKIPIVNILGMQQPTDCPGAVVFQKDGKTYRLDALEENEKQLFLIFADQTTGKETYGAGRYLLADKPGTDGKVVVDFNESYNPPCSFTAFATCPLPPKQNRLPFRIEAGEKKYAGGHPH